MQMYPFLTLQFPFFSDCVYKQFIKDHIAVVFCFLLLSTFFQKLSSAQMEIHDYLDLWFLLLEQDGAEEFILLEVTSRKMVRPLHIKYS